MVTRFSCLWVLSGCLCVALSVSAQSQPSMPKETDATTQSQIAELVTRIVSTEIQRLQGANPTVMTVDYAQLSQEKTREWQDYLTYQFRMSRAQPPADIEERIRESVRKGFAEKRALFDAERRVRASVSQLQQEDEGKRRQQLQAKKWPPAIVEAILARSVVIGMNKEQVQEAWGRPDRRSTDVTAKANVEYWFYNKPFNGLDAVRFRNGIVESLHRKE